MSLPLSSVGHTKLVNVIAQNQTTLIMRNHHAVGVNTDNNQEIESNASPANSYDQLLILRLINISLLFVIYYVSFNEVE